MRVGLDCRVVGRNRGGIRNYVRGLLHGARARSDVEWVLFGMPEADMPVGVGAGRVPLPRRAAYEALRLGLSEVERYVGDVDVFHSPAWWPLGQERGRSVATVLDLSPFVEPAWFPRSWSFMFRWVFPRVLRRADRIIAISEATRRDLVRFYRLDPADIDVVHLAAGDEYRPVPESEARPTLERHGLRWRGYILYVSAIEPRKNVSRLVDACARFPETPLVIVGKPTWGAEADLRRIDRAGPRVRRLGYVEPAELPAIFSGAAVFVYPSLYEGFGLPPLEAMRCGVPVVTSNTTSLPEVVGDAAVLVDPTRVDAIAAGIARVLVDEGLRSRLVESGLRRAALFSWERCARETVAVYDRACRVS